MVGHNLSPLIEIGLTYLKIQVRQERQLPYLLALIQNVQLIPSLPV